MVSAHQPARFSTSTASTLDVIEAALVHQEQNAIRRAYNRAIYWPERVALVQKWADMLDEFKQ